MSSPSQLRLAGALFVVAGLVGWMWSRPPTWDETLARTDAALDALASSPADGTRRAAVLARLQDLEGLAAGATQARDKPREAALLARQGLYYVHTGALEVARAALSTALNLDPEEGRAHEAIALLFLGDGLMEQAAKHLAKAPDTLSVQVARGRVLLADADLDGARRQLALVKSRAPDFAPLMVLEGLMELRLGRPVQARVLFDALAHRPDRPVETLGQIARAYQEAGQGRTAQEFLERAVREGADLSREGVMLGDFYLSDGEYARARTLFKAVLEREGPRPAILSKLAFTEAATGDGEKAQEDADQAGDLLDAEEAHGQIGETERRILRASIALSRARAAHARGDLTTAAQMYTRLLSVAGSLPMANELLSEVDEQRGDYVDALVHYKAFVRSQAVNASMYARLARLAERAGNPVEAASFRAQQSTVREVAGAGTAASTAPGPSPASLRGALPAPFVSAAGPWPTAGSPILGEASVPPATIAPSPRTTTTPAGATPMATPHPGDRAGPRAIPAGGAPLYRDIAGQAGITFAHRLVPPLIYTPHANVPGVAIADLDGDGLADLILLQSGDLFGNAFTTVCPQRNLGNGRFADITTTSGIQLSAFAGGVTACDIDSDGYIDLAVSTVDGLFLLHNCGDGTFRPWPGAYPLAPGWVSAVGIADLDRDGRLDLFATRYARLDAALLHKPPLMISSFQGRYTFPVSLAPAYFPAGTSSLFYARPDGTFADVTEKMHVTNEGCWGMTSILADLDGDGWPDIYIANDGSPNRFYRNDHGRAFKDISRASWADDPRGSMGLALDDLTGNGTPDIAVTNWIDQDNGLFMERRGIVFDDRALERGTGKPDMDLVSWGCVFTDTRNTGDSDLIVANGSTFAAHYDADAIQHAGDPFIPQRPLYYENSGHGAFRLAGDGVFGTVPPRSCRGLAAGDIDNDGGEDLLVGVSCGPPLLFANVAPDRGHWLEVELVGVRSPRQGTGARVVVTTPARAHTRWALAGDSFQSCSSCVLHFGLGKAITCDVRVLWPSGSSQALANQRADRRLRIVEDSPR